jgi:hypothetical protein
MTPAAVRAAEWAHGTGTLGVASAGRRSRTLWRKNWTIRHEFPFILAASEEVVLPTLLIRMLDHCAFRSIVNTWIGDREHLTENGVRALDRSS